ncbi:MAG: hypothetical protein JSU77_01480 [Fidelibacterota bacterium]|nr:MAG: hypothetical protein JSU77_01480 [Candidatus Neomarinimicrobiota bacterium]
MKKHSARPGALLLPLTLLIWLGMACATVTKIAPAADISGRWKAVFETPEGDQESFLNIQKSSDGTLTATMDSPAYGAYNVPLNFSFENGVVNWEIEQVGVSFDGKLIDPSTIEGAILQSGSELGTAIYKRIE